MQIVSFDRRSCENMAFSFDHTIMLRKQRTDNIEKCKKKNNWERQVFKGFEHLLVNTPTDVEEYLLGNRYYADDEKRNTLRTVTEDFNSIISSFQTCI